MTYGPGFAVILLLYASLGALAVTGSILLTRRWLRPKWEQAFYAAFLVPIAGFYLAFADYFSAAGAWPLETRAVLVFVALAVVGIRSAGALALGYLLHGIWDGLHELQAHGAYAAFAEGSSTPTPLAYGVLCATIDFVLAGYVLVRRRAWAADRSAIRAR